MDKVQTHAAKLLMKPTANLGWMSNRDIILALVAILLGAGIGTIPIKLSFAHAVLCFLGLAFAVLSVLRFEIGYTLFIFSLCMMFEVEPMEGHILSIFADKKLPGFPHFIEVVFATYFLSFLIHLIIRKEKSKFPAKMHYVCILMVLLFVSFYVGRKSGVDTILLKEDFKKFSIPILFLFSSLHYLDSKKKITFVLKLCLWLVLIKSFLGAISYLLGRGFVYEETQMVVFLESADNLLFLTAGVTLVSLLASGKMSSKRSVMLLVAFLPIIFCITFSYRRSVWIGLLLSLSLLFLLMPLRNKVKVSCVLSSLVVVFVLFVDLTSSTGNLPSSSFLRLRFLSVFEMENGSNNAHIEECIITFEDIMTQPLLGLGFGSTHRSLPSFPEINTHTVHNAFLMLWMKMGIIPVMLFVIYLASYFKLGLTRLRGGSGNPLQAVALGLFSCIASWFVTLSVGPVWFYYRETCLMAFVSAVVVNIARERRVGFEPNREREI